MNKLLSVFITMLLTLGFAFPVAAEIAVIVHPDNTNSLTQQQVRKIFLGKLKTYPDGSAIQTFDLPSESSARALFLEKVLRKSEANLNSHWARMLFSSKGKPPKALASESAVKAEVASNTSAIGYIDTAAVDTSVKVLFNIK